jgi:predicted helicase
MSKLRDSIYRPFTKKYLFFDRILNEAIYRMPYFFPTAQSEQDNRVICVTNHSQIPFVVQIVNQIPEVAVGGRTGQTFPFYVYDEDGENRYENISDWALAQFRQHYQDDRISKWDIFYYVYGLLHHPEYRERYADILKRDLPRIPFVPSDVAFRVASDAGQQLADLHLNYESVERYPLAWETTEGVSTSFRVQKMRPQRKRDAQDGTYKVYDSLKYNDTLTLTGIPEEAFAYRLGNRSALDWVVEQYQVKTDNRSGITSDPNGYSDDEQYIVQLVERVITVSLRTVELVETLADIPINA